MLRHLFLVLQPRYMACLWNNDLWRHTWCLNLSFWCDGIGADLGRLGSVSVDITAAERSLMMGVMMLQDCHGVHSMQRFSRH